MKLPLKSGRYAALKRLLVFVGTIADEREQWSQLAGVPAAIEGHSPAAGESIPPRQEGKNTGLFQ